MEEMKDELFLSVMRGKWDEVVYTFMRNPSLQKEKITRSGGTALHVAVSAGETRVVSELVKIISASEDDAYQVLSMKNDRGDTALHLAAAFGNMHMSHCMAEINPKLIKIRNSEKETPLFLSVHHGKKETYMCLHSHLKQSDGQPDYSFCRTDNGDTILHAAICAEYFSLAFQIIHDYPNLVNSVNESGLSPLHSLANKPNAFKSGTILGPIDRIIYSCMSKKEMQDPKDVEDISEDESQRYPENYKTCMHFYLLIKDSVKVLTKMIGCKSSDDEENQKKHSSSNGRDVSQEKGKHFYPPNYATIVHYLKFMSSAFLIILGLCFRRIQKIQEKKTQHIWATQVMNELVRRNSDYKYDNIVSNPRGEYIKNCSQTTIGDQSEFLNGPSFLEQPSMARLSYSTASQEKDRNDTNKKEKTDKPMLVAAKIGVTEMVNKFLDEYPMAIQELNTAQKNLVLLTFEKKKTEEIKKRCTPLLIAAKMGVIEMVEKILDTFPVAIEDLDSDKKNVVLLALEHRQTDVYGLLLKRTMLKESIFGQLDNEGNSALHLAAKYGGHRPRFAPGPALEMLSENRWLKFVEDSMPPHFFAEINNLGQTPQDIFTSTHEELVAKGNEWLTKTSESCSVVAALVAAVAFAASTTVPGGIKEDSGVPNLSNEPAFGVFAISSLVALCFSVTALAVFLAILTSRYQEGDFAMGLPTKLLVGFSSLFISISSMLVSFGAAHFFIVKDTLKTPVYPIYGALCLPVTVFAFALFGLVRAILDKKPWRSFKQ